jgi:hypothetical protein
MLVWGMTFVIADIYDRGVKSLHFHLRKFSESSTTTFSKNCTQIGKWIFDTVLIDDQSVCSNVNRFAVAETCRVFFESIKYKTPQRGKTISTSGQ